MDELKRDILRRLANDEILMEALKSCLLNALDINELNPERMTDQDLGAETRARLRAKELVNKGLENIKQLQTNKVERKIENYI